MFAATDVVIDGSFVVAGIGNGMDGTIDVTFEAELGSLLVSMIRADSVFSQCSMIQEKQDKIQNSQ